MIQETESGADGEFVLPCPGETTLVIRAEAPGWAACSVQNPPRNRDLVFRLQLGATLQGALLDSEKHQPLAGGRVELLEYPPDGSLPEELRALFRRNAVTGRNGRFYFEKVPEGVHQLAGRVPGFAQKRHGLFAVSGPPSSPPSGADDGTRKATPWPGGFSWKVWPGTIGEMFCLVRKSKLFARRKRPLKLTHSRTF